jgi:Ca2+-binding EF-hand superfamily protein
VSKIRCLITALLFASAPAFAQAPDGDRGGEQRRAEREAQSEARFKAADRNNDGKLTAQEMEAARAARRAERFAKMDRNRDGGLDREELRAAHEERRAERTGRRHERREGMRERMHARLQALDTDHDQAISRAELGDSHPRLAERFDTIDANRDGKLTREEMQAARQAHKPHQAF